MMLGVVVVKFEGPKLIGLVVWILHIANKIQIANVAERECMMYLSVHSFQMLKLYITSETDAIDPAGSPAMDLT